MGIVGGEQQQMVAQHLDHAVEVLRVLRLVERLGGEADALVHIVDGRTLHPGRVEAYAAPRLVHPPEQRQNPTKAVLDEIGRHTSELQSLMRISYAVFCLKKKKNQHTNIIYQRRYTTHK